MAMSSSAPAGTRATSSCINAASLLCVSVESESIDESTGKRCVARSGSLLMKASILAFRRVCTAEASRSTPAIWDSATASGRLITAWAMLAAISPMRSSSLLILIAVSSSRRSEATGWFSAKIRWHCLSIFRSSLSTLSSRSITIRANSVLPSRNARMANSTCSSTKLPIRMMRVRSLSRFSSKDLFIGVSRIGP